MLQRVLPRTGGNRNPGIGVLQQKDCGNVVWSLVGVSCFTAVNACGIVRAIA